MADTTSRKPRASKVATSKSKAQTNKAPNNKKSVEEKPTKGKKSNITPLVPIDDNVVNHQSPNIKKMTASTHLPSPKKGKKSNIQNIASVANDNNANLSTDAISNDSAIINNLSDTNNTKKQRKNKKSQEENIGLTSEDFERVDQRTHVYIRPGMWISSDSRLIREEWVFDLEKNKITEQMVDLVPAVERLFLEILSNSADNVGRSQHANIDPGPINIVMNASTISVTNYGLPIPIEINQKENMWTPTMIFGSLFAGSNLKTSQTELLGVNGVGSTIVVIFSKDFKVIIHDHIRHLKFSQTWNDNMLICHDPIIEPYDGTFSSVQVIYRLDFERFGYPEPIESTLPDGSISIQEGTGYPTEAFALFARHAVDTAFNTKTKVTFNEHEFNISDIKEYARLYFGDAVENSFVHTQWPLDTEFSKKSKNTPKNSYVRPLIELIAIDAPDNSKFISFVNTGMTRDGGVHLNSAIKVISDFAVKNVNDDISKKLLKQNKGKELNAKDKRSHLINANDVKPHISILLSVRVISPKFTSQSKTSLCSPTPKFNISEEFLAKHTKTWQLFQRLKAAHEAKMFSNLTKGSGKNNQNVLLRKGIDANNAGKTDKQKTILAVVEGDSAAGYAHTWISLMANGRDWVGVLPMRGKGLNVMDRAAGDLQYERNKELKELKEMLGLDECLPHQREDFYLKPENFKKLRYGALMIMADSDVDGKHIIGLILNFFHCRFPSLLKRGFVMFYRTPIIRVTLGRNTLKFYTEQEYQNWKNNTDNFANWTHQYYKGLGSSEDPEIQDDYNNPKIVCCVYDDKAPQAMRLAFDKKLSNQRKQWINEWKPINGADELQMQPISLFIDQELIHFSVADGQRSIPKMMDGFKESHRKIIHCAYDHWKLQNKTKKSFEKFKVQQFANLVASYSGYHHGETILNDVVIKMAQNFVGSNNIPWFERNGQFGKRVNGGKASNGRYIHTKPEQIFPKILRREDLPILTSIVDEGKNIEPETYYPIIPMILINGGQGIGTGYSTFIPNHNPLDIISWLKLKLQGFPNDALPNIIPWYRDYGGEIIVIDRRHKKKIARRAGTKKARITNTSLTAEEIRQLENTSGNGAASSSNSSSSSASGSKYSEALDDQEEDFIEDLQIGETDITSGRPLLSMVTQGKFHIDKKGHVIVTELPIGRFPNKYNKWLSELRQKKIISDYRDLSGENTIYFEIYGYKDVPNIQNLRLQRTYGMSNMVLLNNDNKPVRYDTAADILNTFYEERLQAYLKRKNYILSQLLVDIQALTDKMNFIQAILDKKLRSKGKSRQQVREDIQALGLKEEYMDTVKWIGLSNDDVISLQRQIDAKHAEREVTSNTTLENMWLVELEDLEVTYKRLYK